jgi:hypothetical protein
MVMGSDAGAAVSPLAGVSAGVVVSAGAAGVEELPELLQAAMPRQRASARTRARIFFMIIPPNIIIKLYNQ